MSAHNDIRPFQAEPIGELILSPRAPGDSWTPADRRLLDELARQTGVAARAVRLTGDLQRSRERLVLTREEEVEIPVQVCGRLRGKVKVAAGSGEEEVVKLAQGDAVIAPHLAGKRIMKIIFVPDRLLNLVVA